MVDKDATTCSYNIVTRYIDAGVPKFKLYRVANYYHSGTETGETKAMSRYAKEIKEFKQWCFNKWGYHHFFVDPAVVT